MLVLVLGGQRSHLALEEHQSWVLETRTHFLALFLNSGVVKIWSVAYLQQKPKQASIQQQHGSLTPSDFKFTASLATFLTLSLPPAPAKTTLLFPIASLWQLYIGDPRVQIRCLKTQQLNQQLWSVIEVRTVCFQLSCSVSALVRAICILQSPLISAQGANRARSSFCSDLQLSVFSFCF